MFKLIKINDTTLGHGGNCKPCIGVATNTTNFTVFSEDVLVSTEGNIFTPHTDALACHPNGATYNVVPLSCSQTVFISGKRVTIQNSTLLCGDIITPNPINMLKTKVFIGS